MWVAPARISGKTLRDANQFMFCGLQYRILRRVGGDALACPRDKKQHPNPSTKNEAQLNCVALRPPLDYEVGGGGGGRGGFGPHKNHAEGRTPPPPAPQRWDGKKKNRGPHKHRAKHEKKKKKKKTNKA
jgi:hypothetical protein